jgi:hypothetical protein
MPEGQNKSVEFFCVILIDSIFTIVNESLGTRVSMCNGVWL